MGTVLYAIAALLLVSGLLCLGGYVGKANFHRQPRAGKDMEHLIGVANDEDGCTTCKWY